MSDAPFFLIGAGRSGTTLLRLMLAGHSRLHIPPETWFIRDLVERLPLDKPLNTVQLETAIRLMTSHQRWPDMDFPADTLCARIQDLPSPSLADLVLLAYRHQARLSGKPRVGDKTPHYFMILPQLAAMFPDAKFIHVMRDGRDVAISWIDAGWNRYHEPQFEWAEAMRRRGRWQNIALRTRIHEVRYETLVQAPEKTLRSICQFLGESYEPAMLDWEQRLRLVPSRDRHLHASLHKPLSPDAVAAWQTRLSAWECFAIEACLHGHLLHLGYPLRFSAPALRPALICAGELLRFASPLLKRAVPRLQQRGMLPRRLYI